MPFLRTARLAVFGSFSSGIGSSFALTWYRKRVHFHSCQPREKYNMSHMLLRKLLAIKILVVGTAFNDIDEDMALARYHADGTLDTDFGDGGKVRTDFSGVFRVNINTQTRMIKHKGA